MSAQPVISVYACAAQTPETTWLLVAGPVSSPDPVIMSSARTGHRGDGPVTAARQYDSVRTTAAAESLFDGRAIPAGMEGMVLEVHRDGTCLVEPVFRPQTSDLEGDFVLAELAEGQYEIIRL
jgi:hypothetical protein